MTHIIHLTDSYSRTYVYIPIVQREYECDIFVEQWNAHRIRYQEKLDIPTGVPNHMFSFPEQYGAGSRGHKLRREQLREVAEVSGILEVRPLDFLEEEVKTQCERFLPNPGAVESKNAIEAFRFLKQRFVASLASTS